MEEYDIVVHGLPPGASIVKFHRYINNKINGGRVEAKKLENGKVVLKFLDDEGRKNFLEAEIKTYLFGGKTYQLTYANSEPAASKDEKKRKSRVPDRAIRRDQRDSDIWRRALHVSDIPQLLLVHSAFCNYFESFGELDRCTLYPERQYALITFKNHDAAVQAKMHVVDTDRDIFMKIRWDFKEEPQGQQQYKRQRRPPNTSNQTMNYHEQRNYRPGTQQHQDNQAYNRAPTPHYGRSLAENCSRPHDRHGGYALDEGAVGGHHYETGGLHHSQDADSRTKNLPPLMSLPTQNPDVNYQTKPQPTPRHKARNKQKNKKFAESKNDQDEDFLYQNIHCWTDLKELPAPGGTTCVLARNIDPSTDLLIVKMHFESKKRSGGGPVKSIIRMNDGLLVTFQNQDDSDTCAQKTNQILGETELEIFPKMIPSYHERKFILEGVGQNTPQNAVIMCLESCTKGEVEPSLCEQQEIPGVYIVGYQDDKFDVTKTEEFLSKIATKELPKGSKLKASRLLCSDCLKVIGMPPGASEDEIKLTFESKKRTDGGPVTNIEQLKNGIALVYFAQYTAAERVYNRFSKPETGEVIMIAGKAVTVELYYHSLSKEYAGASKKKKLAAKAKGADKKAGDIQTVSTGPAGTVTTFQLKPSCQEKILFFIQKRKKHYNALKDSFKDTATVVLRKLPNGRVVEFLPAKKEGDQEKYNEECKKYFENFVSQFSMVSESFDKEKLQKARASKKIPLLEKMADNRENTNLAIEWQDNTVEVTGLKDAVERAFTDIESAIDTETTVYPLDEENYRAMLYCGIIKELEEKFSKAKIHYDKETKTLSYTGSASDVNKMQVAALGASILIKRGKIADLTQCAQSYLIDNAENAVKKIQERIFSSDIKAQFGIDDEGIYLKYRNREEHKRALDVVTKMIATERIPIDGPYTNAVQSPAWKMLQQSIQQRSNCGIYVKPGDSIMIVGLQSEIRSSKTKVENFLKDNVVTREYISMSYGHAKFLLERKHEFSKDSSARKAVSCDLTRESGGGIFIEGIRQNLTAARLEINKVLGVMQEKKHTLKNPGVKKYYLDGEGRGFLETTSFCCNCIILVNSPDCEEWVRHNRQWERKIVEPKKSSPVFSSPQNSKTRPVYDKEVVAVIRYYAKDTEQNLFSSKIGRVTLSVWKTNIIEHQCDVIVNASNKELCLLARGISGAIKQLDQIQNEMKRIIQSNFGDLAPGDAVITGSGNLPNCRKIVHAVGPKWTNPVERSKHPELVLKACISKSLEITEKAGLRSISIPGISCGVFGGVPSTCVPLITEAVMNYFNDNKSSIINKVDFVEFQNQQVLDEFVKAVKKYAPQTSAPPPTPKARQANPSSQSTSGAPLVTLVEGDIAVHNADVIVNIMSPDHVADIARGSAIAQALAAAAGSVVVNACSQQQNMHGEGSVFETSVGNLACNGLYHGLISKYNPANSEALLKSVVQRCLRMADTAGFNSIAFPAIGTGGFRYPAQSVAKWMSDIISQFNGTSLTKVAIVLHHSNRGAITAFKAEFGVNPSQNISSGGQQTAMPASVVYGPLAVSVLLGDITSHRADAIVNSTNRNFDLSKGMISHRILTQGGQSIQSEISQNRLSGKFVVTSAGALPCNNIVHLVTQRNEQNLCASIEEILELAEKKNFSSIAFPPIGTGNAGMDCKTVGLMIRNAIDKFVSRHPTTNSLNAVDIVIFDQSALQHFKDAILGENAQKKSWFSKVYEGVKEKVKEKVFGRSEPIEDKLDLFLYAAELEQIGKAIQAISDKTNKVMEKSIIDDDALARFGDLEYYEIDQIQKKFDVKILDSSDRYLNRLTIIGLSKNVGKAKDDVRNILQEFSKAETCVQYISWEKLEHGKWQEFPPRAAHTLEKAYKEKDKLSQVKVKVYQSGSIVSETHDISKVGKDQAGGKSQQIRRTHKERTSSDDLPSTWEDMKGKKVTRVILDPNSTEYQTVLNKARQTGLTANAPQIERIQSVSLYKQYMAENARVTAVLKGTGHTVERQLFHGTSNADAIIAQGFNRSFAGLHAAAFGNGVYFAVKANYSHNYTLMGFKGMYYGSAANIQRTMFLADVITGQYAQGSKGLKVPPSRQSHDSNDLYESVVDDVNNPSMYVIFKDASAYPTYLITYT